MARKPLISSDVKENTRPAIAVSLAGPVIGQGECVLDADMTAKPLVNTPCPCSRVWIAAPSMMHTHSAQNQNPVLIGRKSAAEGGNAAGGIYLAPDNFSGFFYPADDASQVYVEGGNGDCVEYQIFE